MKLELHSIPQISQHAICQPTLAGPDPEHALYQRPEGPLPWLGQLPWIVCWIKSQGALI